MRGDIISVKPGNPEECVSEYMASNCMGLVGIVFGDLGWTYPYMPDLFFAIY